MVVGHDASYCAELFAREVARVLAANGLRVILLDRVTPTPAVSWTVVEQRAGGGVVVTASHNPMEFNGLKYKPDFGGSASPEVVAELETNTVKALSKGVKAMSFDEAVSSGAVTLVDPLPSYCAQLGRMVDVAAAARGRARVAHEAMYGAGAGTDRTCPRRRPHHGHRAALRTQPRLRWHAPGTDRPLHARGDGTDGRERA